MERELALQRRAVLVLVLVLAAVPLFSQVAGSPLLAVSGVVSQGGVAAPGVEVLLRPWPSAWQAGLHELGVPDALPAAAAEVLSDADGRFHLTAPAVGPYRLEFRFAGGATAMPAFHCPLLPLAVPVVLGVIDLPSLYRLAVRAEDSAGVPVPGAQVLADEMAVRPPAATTARNREAGSWFLEPGPSVPCRPQAGRVAARTGEDGWVHLLVPHVRSAVLVSAPGHLPSRRTVDSDEASFRLEPDAGVKVRVRAPDGRPAPGVLVRTSGPAGIPLGLTDERGEAMVHLVDPRGQVARGDRQGARIEFESAGHASARVALPASRLSGQPAAGARGLAQQRAGEVEAGARHGTRDAPGGARGAADADTEEIDVELQPPARFHGRVVEADSGQAIAGAVAWFAADPGWGARADQYGALDVPVPPGGGGLGVAAAGYLLGALEVGAAETPAAANVVIGLTSSAPLHGRVVDGLGGAVPGATVKAVPNNRGVFVDQWLTGFGSVLSAADGSFRVATAVHGRPYRLTAAAEGHATAVREIPAIERGGPSPPVELVVTRGRQPWGTVTDSAGAPVEAAEVSLLRAADFAPIDASRFAPPAAEPVATNARGEFEFPNIAPGTYGLRVEHLEHLALRLKDVNVPPGEGYADLGVFKLAAGADVHGVVTGPNGRAVSGAEVFGRQEMHNLSLVELTARTDRDGRFRLAGLAEAPVDIGVIAEGHAPQALTDVRPGTGEPILIELAAGASLAGTVRREDGSPAAGVKVHLASGDTGGWVPEPWLPAEARTHSLETRGDGTFRADDLPPGAWSVSAADGAGAKVEERVRLVAGDLREVELQFGEVERLTVAVTNPHGQPVAQAGVSVHTAGRWRAVRGTTDISGRVVLSVKAGQATVRAFHSRWRPATQEAVLGSGTNEIAIRLGEGIEITGHVRTVDGRAVPGAVVDAESDYFYVMEDETDSAARTMADLRWAGLTPRTFTDAAGAFRLTGIKPGTLYLSATLPGHAMRGEPQKIKVESRSVTGVVIELVPEVSIRGVVSGLGEAGMASARMPTVEVVAWRGLQMWMTTPDHQGAFVLDGLSPGEWRVWATSADRRTPMLTVRFASGATSDFVELRFDLGYRLSGQVFLEGGPLAGRQVVARHADDRSSRQVRTDHQGRFVFEGLPAGMHRVTVPSPAGTAAEREIDLQSDVDQLIFDLVPTGDLP